MEPINYLRAFKRRWAVIAASVAVAVGVGWVTMETVAPVRPRSVTYSAETVLWSSASFGAGAASSPIGDMTARLLSRDAQLAEIVRTCIAGRRRSARLHRRDQ